MLLVECNVLEKVEVINEGTGTATRLRLRGKFQQCDEQNNNGRIYPRSILESQVKAIQEKIGDRSLVGALDHPANDAIHLSQASHVITGLSIDKDGSVMGECEILSTPNGQIVQALINDGVKIGISSRGVGSVTEGIKGKIVNEDFKLITFDLVSDPSTRGAYPELTESIRENSQRAQKIVTKHKQDRVLLTMLENKISEALKGKQKKLDKNKNNKIDAEDFKMLRGEDDSMDEKSFPDLSGDGKVTMKDVLMGRGVIKKGKKKKSMGENEEDMTPDQKKTYKRGKNPTEDPKDYLKARAEYEKKNPGKSARMPREDSSIDIRAIVLEAFKDVCWGDRYDEMGEVKRRNRQAQRDRHRRMFGSVAQGRRAAQRAQGEPQSNVPPTQAQLKRKLKAKHGSNKTSFAKNITAKQAGERREDSSIDIRATVIEGFKKACWGDKYHEAYRPGEGERVRKEVEDQGKVERPEARKARLAREEKAAQEKYRQEHAAQFKKN